MSQIAGQTSQNAMSTVQDVASDAQGAANATSAVDAIFAAPHLRWGVIGCGVIANQMAEALAELSTV